MLEPKTLRIGDGVADDYHPVLALRSLQSERIHLGGGQMEFRFNTGHGLLVPDYVSGWVMPSSGTTITPR